jgi:hypothetical protein
MTPDKLINLYGGKICIEYYDAKHWYIRKDVGRIITSVTGATSLVSNAEVLMGWATKLAKNHLLDILGQGGMICDSDIYDACGLYRAKRDEAGDIGTAVHNMIEAYIKSRLTKRKFVSGKVPEKVMYGFIAFKDWVEKNEVEFEASEQIVYSCKYDFVGTLDCRAKVNGKTTLIDFKTGNYLSDTVPFQVSAYLEADAEESGRKYEDRMVLHIMKDTGDFKAIHLGMEEHKHDFNAFVGLLTAKERLKTKNRNGGGKK